MPNPVGYIWDENHPAQGHPGWNPVLYWPWENVRFLLTFLPARMRTSNDRAVIIMYKPSNQPLPQVNPLGLRAASLQRLICWCCGPSRADACLICDISWMLLPLCHILVVFCCDSHRYRCFQYNSSWHQLAGQKKHSTN